MKIFDFCHRQKWVRKIGFRVVSKDEFRKDRRAEARGFVTNQGVRSNFFDEFLNLRKIVGRE
ncbi:hypothetical protein CL630_03505 [bacterium]|nr:hypothetical protein [bacterium]